MVLVEKEERCTAAWVEVWLKPWVVLENMAEKKKMWSTTYSILGFL
jgi:hypothetical protein